MNRRLRIRGQLLLAGGLMLGALALMVGVSGYHQLLVARQARAQAQVAALVSGAQDLAVLAGESLLYPGERVRQQWALRYATVGKALAAHCCNAAPAVLRADVDGSYQAIGRSWTRLVDLGSPAQDDADRRELRGMLSARLIYQVRDFTSALLQLRALEHASVRRQLAVSRGVVLLVDVLALALAGLLFWVLARSLVRPLGLLERGIARFAAGDVSQRLSPQLSAGRADELGDLARTFDAMAEQVAAKTQHLEASRAALATLNQELEQRVAERTAALNQTNQALEDAVRQLYDAGRELAQTQRLAAAGQLVASISHRLHNPLMGALNYVQHVARNLGDDPLARWLGKAEREIVRAAKVTDDLGTLARAESEAAAAADDHADLAATLTQALALVESLLVTRGIACSAQLPPGLPPVAMSTASLRQVLLNLLLNAADAVSDQQKPVIVVGGAADGDAVAVWVEDSGPGVPAVARERVFEPFYTTKPGATAAGLGLTVARRLAEAAGGTLTLADVRPPGAPASMPADPGGARMLLRLPAEVGEEGETVLGLQGHPGPRADKRLDSPTPVSQPQRPQP